MTAELACPPGRSTRTTQAGTRAAHGRQRKNESPAHRAAALRPRRRRCIRFRPFRSPFPGPSFGTRKNHLTIGSNCPDSGSPGREAATPTAGRVGGVQKLGHPDTPAPCAWGFNPSGPTCHLALLALGDRGTAGGFVSGSD